AANRFAGTFQGGSAIVFDRASILSGLPATYQAFNTSYGSLLPSDLDGANLPPAGSPNYFANRGGSTLNLWKFHVDWATPGNSTNRWMGSVAMDGSGDMALGYSVSSSSVYPSIRYTGRLVSDPLGTMPQGETTLFDGSGSQTGSASRWGDYSMMAVDPSDD